MNDNLPATAPSRLASLDILRGADLFLLVFFQPVLLAVGRQADLPWLNAILWHFDHEAWAGFRFWDLVMPLFLFMSGVSLPFSLGKYRNATDKGAVYRKILKRFVLLFLLGMVVQGNLLGLDPDRIYLYSNTLQAIASGYLIASLLLLHCSVRAQIGAAALLLLAYWAPMTFLGDFTREGNFAEQVDRLVLGRFRDGAYRDETGAWHFAPWYDYTWVLSTLTFGVTVLLGALAGQVMKNGQADRRRTALTLFAAGLALTAAGWAWSFQMPIIKRLWTCSMTLLSGGYCFLLMALFYYVIDCKGRSRGLNWLKFYGMNSITAYMLGECVNFRCIAASVSYGLEQYLGDYYAAWLTFANYLIVLLILRAMYRHRIFLKI